MSDIRTIHAELGAAIDASKEHQDALRIQNERRTALGALLLGFAAEAKAFLTAVEPYRDLLEQGPPEGTEALIAQVRALGSTNPLPTEAIKELRMAGAAVMDDYLLLDGETAQETLTNITLAGGAAGHLGATLTAATIENGGTAAHTADKHHTMAIAALESYAHEEL